ncbi:MAG TPA: LUD domain-containing protein [Rhizomicrobium sp.]|jgi:L-lactate dehydrogenase complex protein LldG|nr:LUD domain-containing protein [Rhizomicrobium sp.]
MTAREDILSAIRARHVKNAPRPPAYRASDIANSAEAFAERARLANAEVRVIDSESDVPRAIADLLRAKNLPAELHIPPGAPSLPWTDAPSLTLKQAAPGPDDAALAFAPFGIAETGTLAYAAGLNAPASWHFRAGFEIAVVRAADILPHMEGVLARVKAVGALSSTLNFVTGPSRTGDIEQTLELGAHGPKALAILIVKT